MEEQIKKYVMDGGKLFRITNIDTIRDGGTRVIETTDKKYYVDKTTNKFHSGYPTLPENLITDEPHVYYLIDRMESYIKLCENDLITNKDLLNKIETSLVETPLSTKLYDVEEIERLKELYSFQLIGSQMFMVNEKPHFVKDWNMSLPELLEKFKDKEIYIFEPALPEVRAIVTNPVVIQQKTGDNYTKKLKTKISRR